MILCPHVDVYGNKSRVGCDAVLSSRY